MARRHDPLARRTAAVAAVALVCASFAGAVLSPGVLLLLAPAFVLFVALAVGRMPGERLIARLRRRLHVRRPRLARLAVPQLPVVVRPAGRTLAAALAMRPPPPAALRADI